MSCKRKAKAGEVFRIKLGDACLADSSFGSCEKIRLYLGKEYDGKDGMLQRSLARWSEILDTSGDFQFPPHNPGTTLRINAQMASNFQSP